MEGHTKWQYKSNKVRLNDEEVVLPWSLVRAIANSPYNPQKSVRSDYRTPKAYANPNGAGYGGGETPWPFDRKRAYTDGRYRAGIRNAINSDWVAPNWRDSAQRELVRITEDLLAAEEVFDPSGRFYVEK